MRVPVRVSIEGGTYDLVFPRLSENLFLQWNVNKLTKITLKTYVFIIIISIIVELKTVLVLP